MMKYRPGTDSGAALLGQLPVLAPQRAKKWPAQVERDLEQLVQMPLLPDVQECPVRTCQTRNMRNRLYTVMRYSTARSGLLKLALNARKT